MDNNAEKQLAAESDKALTAKTDLEKKENRLEVVVVIFLGIAALLVAWATWIGSVHGGNMTDNFTKSNNVSDAGTTEYDAASQLLLRDMNTWDLIQDYLFEKGLAVFRHDADEAQMIQDKVDRLISNCPETLRSAIDWAYEQDETGAVSPFMKEGMMESYFSKAQELMEESRELLEQGEQNSRNCDKYGLATVICALVLFLLGIVGIFKRLPNRRAVFWIAVVLLVFGIVYMCLIPLPTGFSFADYF